MDESLKRRLIGAGLLLLAAFLLASMLPEPRLRKARDPGQSVVTIELQEPEPIATPDVAAMAVTPLPNPVADPPPDEEAEGSAGADEAETSPDIESGDRSALVAPSPALAPRPSPRPSPQAVQQAAVPTAAPTALPTPSPARAAIASPSTAPTPSQAAPAGAGNRWWIQIGSYSDIANARIVETRMRAIGQIVLIAPVDTRNGVLYRVRCGPYASQAAGQEVHARVVAAGYPEARLINP